MKINYITNSPAHIEHQTPESTFNCSVPPSAKKLITSASLSFRYPSKDRNNEETRVLVATF